MAVPPRPVTGEFATSEWGDWVHDQLVGTVRAVVGMIPTAGDASATSAVVWPPNNTVTATVPDTASKVHVIAKIDGWYPVSGDVVHQMRLYIDGISVAQFNVQKLLAGAGRHTIILMGQKDVTAKRGAQITMHTTAQRISAGSMRTDTDCRLDWDYEFKP
jgi:phosphoserine aminotransferase